jgi:hypothetical protein
MDIVYAAEKPSIATLLSERVKHEIGPEDITVTENPDQTGSFFIGYQLNRYVMSPDGDIALENLEIID